MKPTDSRGVKLSISVKIAYIEDIDELAIIFNKYRIFYGESDNMNLSRQFLGERFRNKQSTVFLARLPSHEVVGFAQLYPVFSSIAAKSAWILNDLFVEEKSRKIGIASALIYAVLNHGNNTNAAWVTLQTANENIPAQALYKKFGFSQEQQYLTFNHRLAWQQ
jgi:ribosomal protein S18 acetylase RimI-like enzyme